MLRILTLVSFGTEMELSEDLKLINSLLRIIQKARKYPKPSPQINFIKSEENQFFYFHEHSEVNEHEGNTEEIIAEYLRFSESGIKKQRKTQILKIFLNFSFNSENKKKMSKHVGLMSLLMELLLERSSVPEVTLILANCGKHLEIHENFDRYDVFMDFMYSDDWEIVLSTLNLFKKLSLSVCFSDFQDFCTLF